jgi:penicillin-binding protein 1A
MTKKIEWFSEIANAWHTLLRALGIFVKVAADVLITVLLIFALAGVIMVCAFSIYIKNYVKTDIDISQFDIAVSNGTKTSQLYRYEFSDRTNRVGEAVLYSGETISGGSDSTYVTYDRFPENMINAVIAIEDKRFKTHKGVDWKRTVAAGVNFFTGMQDYTYGASTITQQLIKNITGEDDYTIQRKIQEIFWALDLETKKDKEEILELYLNIANFGSNYYGVQAAAYNYFSKDVSELTLVECAAIAGITQNPSRFNPVTNPEENRVRREYILYEMMDQGLITRREYEEAHGQTLEIRTPQSQAISESQAKGINSWYTDMVIEDVIDDLIEQKGISRKMASLMVYNGGLKIYCLVDTEVQSLLESIYLDDSKFPKASSGLIAQSSAIVIDPSTGDILGVVGARRTKTANRLQNYATQTLRSPGSSIKPLAVYTQAIERGLITWATVFDDTPVNFTASASGWPKNSETFGSERSTYRGLTNVNYALTWSLNTISVKVLELVGLQESFNFCKTKLNLTDLLESKKLSNGSTVSDITLASLGLGQLCYGVTLREMASAYSVFPNNGVYNESHSYLKVTDAEGNTVLENNYKGHVAFRENTISIMNLMLKNVVQSGTAAAVSLGKLTGVDVAGKTGSAGEVYDRWFIGYTPYYICGVWYGYDYPKTLPGTNPCLSVFDNIMLPLHQKVLSQAALNGETVKKFNVTNDIVQCEYCVDSGLLATETCSHDPRGSRRQTGYFIKGTEPKDYCTTHVMVSYDTVSGGVNVCGDCPEENCIDVALVRVNRDFNTSVSSITIQDAQYSYMDLPWDVMPYTTVYVPFYYNLTAVTKDQNGRNRYHWTGYTRRVAQYNHTCLTHFDQAKWRSEYQAERARRQAMGLLSGTGAAASSVTDLVSVFSDPRAFLFSAARTS